MPHQPSLFSSEPGGLPPPPGDLARRAPVPQRRQAHSPWLERTELLVRVIVRLYLGLLIIVLPWMRFWTENGLFTYSRGVALLAGSGFVRGMVSGLGVLNVAMAFQELFSRSRNH